MRKKWNGYFSFALPVIQFSNDELRPEYIRINNKKVEVKSNAIPLSSLDFCKDKDIEEINIEYADFMPIKIKVEQIDETKLQNYTPLLDYIGWHRLNNRYMPLNIENQNSKIIGFSSYKNKQKCNKTNTNRPFINRINFLKKRFTRNIRNILCCI